MSAGVPLDPALLDGLLRRCAEGDQAAFAHLYDHTVDVIWPLVLKQTALLPAAELLTRTIYASLWQQAPDLVRNEYPCPWTAVLGHARRFLPATRNRAAGSSDCSREPARLMSA